MIRFQPFNHSLLACVALLSTTSLFAQPVSLIEALPGEANIAFSVKNLPALQEKLSAGTMGAAWKSPEMEPSRTFFDESYAEAQTELEEKIGLNLTRLLTHIKGDVIVYNTLFELNETGDLIGDVVLAFTIDPNDVDAIRNDIALATEKLEAAQKIEKTEYEFQGVTVRQLSYEEVSEVFDYDETTGEEIITQESTPVTIEYGFIAEPPTFFLSEGPKNPGKLLINSLLNAEAPKLSQSTSMQTFNGLLQTEGDVMFFADLPKVLAQAKTISLAENPESQSGWDIFDATGFSTLQGFGVQFSFVDQGMVYESAVLVPRERIGVLAALYPENALTLASATQTPSDAISYRAFQLDLGRIWDSIDQILVAKAPEAKTQLDQGVAFANMQMQTNLVNNIIKNIGGEHFYYQSRDPKGAERAATRSAEAGFTIPEQLITSASFATINGELANTAFNTIFEVLSGEQMGMPYAKSDFNGLALWGPDPEKADATSVFQMPTFGLASKQLLISSDEAEMKSFARRVTTPEAGSTLNDNAEFQQAISPYSKEFMAYVEYSSPDNLPFLMKQMENLPGMDDSEVDMDAMIPEAEWFKKYFGPIINVTYTRPEAIYSQGITYMIPQQ